MRANVTQRSINLFFEWLPRVASIVVGFIAVLVVIGWSTEITELRSIFPGKAVMVPINSATFIFGAIALWFGARVENRESYGIIAYFFGFLVIAVASITLAEYLLNVNLGIDMILFPEEMLKQPWNPPGRMAVNTAITHLLSGLALISIPNDARNNTARAQIFAGFALVLAFLALIGHLFNATYYFSLARTVGMSPITATAFIFLNGGAALSARASGLAGLLVDHGAAGMLVRRLLPAGIIIPVIFGWLRLGGERAGFYDSSLGVALYVVASVIVFVTLVIWSARVVRQADTVKSDFLAVMSHELRTPLSAILGYEELLADGITGPVNDSQKQQLGRIKNSAQHLLGLIDQILTFSRLDAGKHDINLQPIAVNALMEQSADLVEPLARDRGLGFKISLLDDPIKIKTDVQKCSQILVNLLSNAVKFTDHGSVSLEARLNGNNVNFIVRDTGIGISPKHVELIFDPFWQVEQKATRRAGGTGLGLSVSRQLARLLGGELTVHSEVGVGSTFTVSIPKNTKK